MIRLIAVKDESEKADDDNGLKKMLDDFRIDATPLMVADMAAETVVETSKDAAVVFLPFRLQHFKFVDATGYSLTRVLLKLPHVALVKASEDIDLTAEPEEGIAGEIASALDELAEAQKKAKISEKEAEEAKRKIEELKQVMSANNSSHISDENHDIIADIDKVEKEALKADRKAAKAKLKLADAENKIQKLAPVADEKDKQGKP